MPSNNSNSAVVTFTINQARTHLFRDLYIANTMLVLVQSGSKQVRPADDEPLDVTAGELLIFPSGTFITIENRIISGNDYIAWCASYPDELIEEVFGQENINAALPSAIAVGKCPEELSAMLKQLTHVVKDGDLPETIKRHRQLEPLIWLKSMGVSLATKHEKSLDQRLRELFSTNLENRWRANDVAHEFGLSEATFRRRLQDCQTSFSETLMTVRLEHGLTLLQTTHEPISQIAMICGFATPSHFSDAFKTRFEISPKFIRHPAPFM